MTRIRIGVALSLLAIACSGSKGSPVTSSDAGTSLSGISAGGTSTGGTSAGGTSASTSTGTTSPGSNARAFIVGVGPTWKFYYGPSDDQPVPTPTSATIQDMVTGMPDVAQMVIAQSGWRAIPSSG